jgi:hypothetical protein
VNTWKIILATMVIFGTGVVTGGLLVHHEQIRVPRPLRATGAGRPALSPPASPNVMRLEFLRRAQRDLDLTPEQRERIDQVIKQSQEHTRELMKPLMPQLQEELRRTREEFLQELTPSQRARFEELVKQQQRPRDQRRPTPAHGEHPPESAPSR